LSLEFLSKKKNFRRIKVKKLLFAFLLCGILVVPTFADAPKQLVIWWQPGDDCAKAAIAEYQKLHPDVKLEFKEMGNDQSAYMALKLALQNGQGPDIAQSNQGVANMGDLVRADLIIPLDTYYNKLGWDKLFGKSLLAVNQFNRATMKQASGPIFGVSSSAEYGMIFYNKAFFAKAGIKETPKTFDEFEADMALLKKSGVAPLVWGSSGNSIGNAQLFEVVLGNYANAEEFARVTFDIDNKASYGNAELAALTKMQEWFKKGYTNSDYMGITPDDQRRYLAIGKGAMLLDGTWNAQTIVNYCKEADIDIGMFLMPTKYGVTFGSVNTCASISKACKNPDLAADFLDFLVKDTKNHIKYNLIPIAKGGDFSQADPTFKQMCEMIEPMYAKNQFGYYFDWATPTMFNTLSVEMTKVVALKITPAQCVQAINADYAKAHSQE
jgi:raffinose/stachyose/melibiose transport system substrate-binding protein